MSGSESPEQSALTEAITEQVNECTRRIVIL